MIKISDSLSEKYQHSTYDFDDDTTPLKKQFNKYQPITRMKSGQNILKDYS